MVLTKKKQKYSSFIQKICFFLTFFSINSNISEANSLKNTEIYKKYGDQFNFETNIKITTDIDDRQYEYELMKQFIDKNDTEDKDKKLLTYAIASEFLLYSNSNYDLNEIDIKYINNLKNVFINGSFKYQCSTSTTVTNVLLYFGIIIKENEFKENIFNCKNYLDQIEFAFLILNMISSRSYISTKNDLFVKKLALELEKLNFDENNINYIHKLQLGSCDPNKLFKYKSYSTLIYYYRMMDNTNKVIDNYNKAKLIKNICVSNFDNALLELEMHYRFYIYQVFQTNDQKKKLEIFNEFDQIAKDVFQYNIEELYINNWYLDFYLVNAQNEYELNENTSLLKQRLDFVGSYAEYTRESQLILSLVEDLKGLYLNGSDQTKGLLNKENSYFKEKSIAKEQFWLAIDELKPLENDNYKGAIDLIDKFEKNHGELIYPNDKYLIEYKYLCLYLDKQYVESIDYVFKKVNKYTESSFNQQGINFFSNSQNPEILEIIEDTTTKIVDSLFVLQYGDGYELRSDQRRNIYPDAYNELLPRALDMLLYLGQLSDLNEANHSIKYLKLKDELKSVAKNLGYEKLPDEIDKQIKQVYQNEKEFLLFASSGNNDLNEIKTFNDKINDSYNNLYSTKFWTKVLNNYPNINLNNFQPSKLFEIQTKLRSDEQFIYLKEFKKNIYAIGISHNDLNWMRVDENEFLELKNLINKYKNIISDPRVPFDQELSHQIYSKLFWKFFTLDSMEFTSKVYFVTSSNFIDIPLETLQFIKPNENNVKGSYLIDYFAFNYLPSIDFFQKTTKNKLIFSDKSFSINPYYDEDQFIGYRLTDLQTEPLIGQFYEGDIIVAIDGQEVNYFTLLDFVHINSKKKGYSNSIKVLRNNKIINFTISNLDYHSKTYDYDFVGFGDPSFNSTNKNKDISLSVASLRMSENGFRSLDKFYNTLPPLPETRDEILSAEESIKKIPEYDALSNLNYSGSTAVYLGKDANEQNFKRLNNKSTRFLTFATHAINLDDQSFLTHPSLVLAPGDGKPLDGLLSTEEVSNMKLISDLTILSACNTFSAEENSGSKLSGFANAFFMAGSENIILSRWPVASEETAYLMKRFYMNPILTLDYTVSLRIAMLEAKDVNAHPFYWASFFTIGK
tara:strand:+ start:5693 stop:9085 length:3393 start_codon:yes stop_codon:yes gene_type:complete